MRINANIAAINASRNLMASNEHLGRSLDKLAHAHRVDHDADDAARLSLSEGLRAEIRGNTQAQRNAQDGISYIQTAEGALTDVHDLLRRMRHLAAQADAKASAGSSSVDEHRLVEQLVAEIRRIGARTTFSGQTVFADYATSALSFQVGAYATDQMTAIDQNLDLDSNGVFSAILALDLTSETGTRTALDALDGAIDDVSHVRSTLGATQNRLEHTVANLSVAVENLMASESHIGDTGRAAEIVDFTTSQILSDAGTARAAQANAAPQNILLLLQG